MVTERKEEPGVPKKKKKKRHVKTLVIGHHPDGKAKRKFIYGKTPAEAKAKYEELRRMHAKGIELGDMSVYEWSKLWLKKYKTDTTATQLAHHKAKLKNDILPAIGHLQMKAVRDSDLKVLMSSFAGGKKGTVDKIKLTIKQLFDDAAYDRVIEYNPAARLKSPKVVEAKRRPLTDVERKAVLLTAKEHECGPYVLVMLYCGVRRGECAALTRGDVNLEERYINVDKAYSYSTDSKGILTGTKAENMRKNRIDTEEGELYSREIPITDALLPVLTKVCEGKNPDDLLFPKDDGKNAAKGTLAWWWKSFVRQCHINAGAKLYRNAIVYKESPFAKEVTPHYLRHTFATDMRAAGIEEKDRDYFMGHNSGDIGSVYAAMSDAVRERALEKLNTFYTDKNNQQKPVSENPC